MAQPSPSEQSVCIAIRGGNDIASAVTHRLFTAGYSVVIIETPQPLTVRRGMAYASAVYERQIALQGVTAGHAPTVEAALALLRSRSAIPVMAPYA